MRTRIIPILLVIIPVACNKIGGEHRGFLEARVVAYDENCSVCILDFPGEAEAVAGELGESPDGRYRAVNLDMNDYYLGQLLLVKIRETDQGDTGACTGQYADIAYRDIEVTRIDPLDEFPLNDTLVLREGECIVNQEEKLFLCLDSVINDSRCPEGAVCFWEGDATAVFDFSVDTVFATLSLHTNHRFPMDTLVNGYRVKLLWITPYPRIFATITPGDYRACFTVICE
ncbi:MAG: hypothetical protein ACOYXB_07295 [Bacteroidota bacterium]